jgi:dihydroorotate dehydrogenase (NAD+) catalytic subunit
VVSLILSSGKRDLILRNPVLNSAGMLGFSDELRAYLDLQALGAFITNPVSLHPRTPAHGPRTLRYHDGILMHTGLPNPGVDRITETHASRWMRMQVPVIPHLLVQDQDEVRALLDRLERLDCIQAVEIGLLGELHEQDCRLIETACTGMLPVIARVPVNSTFEQILEFERIGAAAITLGPPRGSLPHEETLISGRLYSPGLLPQVVQAGAQLAGHLSTALIAGCGVFTRPAAEQLLALGFSALQLDTVLWTQPDDLLDPPLTFNAGLIA